MEHRTTQKVAIRMQRTPTSLRWIWASILSHALYPKMFATFGPKSVLVRPRTILGADRIHIGRSCVLAADAWLAAEPPAATIHIGDEVGFAPGVHIHAMDPISIGSNCSFAESVYVGSADHNPANHSEIRGTGPIRIEDGCFIGIRAVILGGVTIGSGAVVGAHAVVTRDVPPGAVVSGAPAREHRR